jgi:hypothetical protein
VPRAGVTKVGEVARTLFPDPVLVTLTTFLDASKASAVEAVKFVNVVVPVLSNPVVVRVVPLKTKFAESVMSPLVVIKGTRPEVKLESVIFGATIPVVPSMITDIILFLVYFF